MIEDNQNNTPEVVLTPQKTDPTPKKRSEKQKYVLLLLGGVVLSVVFLLPNYVNKPWIADDAGTRPETPNSSPSIVSPSTEAEKTKYRRDSQTLLAEIIATRDRLAGQNVTVWAEIDFRQTLEKIEAGDQQYSFGEYKESMASYEQVLKELKELEALGQAKLNKAVSDGLDAIEAVNISVANASSELANLIAPDDQRVQTLVARNATLSQLADQLEAGDGALAANQLVTARTAYEKAVELDPAHKRAASSLAAIKKDVTESVFRQHMSTGYAALDANEFEKAKSAFMQAGRVYPGHLAVEQALAQLENQKDQLGVSQQISRAAELESREEWQQALSIYEELLAQDPSLIDVKVKLIPVRVRTDLDERMTEIFTDPLKLSEGSAYRKAGQTLNDARGIPNPGEKLQDQIAKLDKLMKTALSPVNVTFQSDNLTAVTLYRVAELGQFVETSLVLKPGLILWPEHGWATVM